MSGVRIQPNSRHLQTYIYLIEIKGPVKTCEQMLQKLSVYKIDYALMPKSTPSFIETSYLDQLML